MKKLGFGLLAAVAFVAVGLTIVAARYEEKIRPNVTIGPVPVGGLTKEEAAFRLRQWWETTKREPLSLSSRLIKNLPQMTPGQLGVTLDDQASVATLPVSDFWDAAESVVSSQQPEPERRDPVFKSNGIEPDQLKKLVSSRAGHPKPAKVTYVAGQIVRVPEVSGYALDDTVLLDSVAEAILKQQPVDIEVKEAPKKISDEQLSQITEVVSEFKTHFPASQYSRNSNIRLAASKLNGVVLMPGESMSFNTTVGRRTIEDGFKEAGVYRNGKHDVGIGGGICQVSTTLYNASLFANLKIVKRQNHSMPVAYVPVGRDATVDYGNIDLVVENSYDTPIAINSEFQPGTLTFRVLGKKDPGLSIKITSDGFKSWSAGVKTVQDGSLAPGSKRVVEKGSMGRSIFTYRLVYKDGKLVKKEPLGRSYYRGGVRIVAVNNKPAPPPASQPETGGAPQPQPTPSSGA